MGRNDGVVSFDVSFVRFLLDIQPGNVTILSRAEAVWEGVGANYFLVYVFVVFC